MKLCNFCGKGKDYVSLLIASKRVDFGEPIHICDECVDLCEQIVMQHRLKEGRSMQAVPTQAETETLEPEALNQPDRISRLFRESQEGPDTLQAFEDRRAEEGEEG